MAEQLPGAGGHGQDRPVRTPVAQGGPGTEGVLDTSAGSWSGWTGFWLHPLPPTHTQGSGCRRSVGTDLSAATWQEASGPQPGGRAELRQCQPREGLGALPALTVGGMDICPWVVGAESRAHDRAGPELHAGGRTGGPMGYLSFGHCISFLVLCNKLPHT